MSLHDAIRVATLSPSSKMKPYWKSVEECIGTKLPKDYKLLIDIFGSTELFLPLSLAMPTGWDDTFNPKLSPLIYFVNEGSNEYSERKKAFSTDFPSTFPFEAFPTVPGLLCFGGTEFGGFIYWHTAGEPHEWSTVIYSEDFYEFEKHDCGIAEFLMSWVQGERESIMLGRCEGNI